MPIGSPAYEVVATGPAAPSCFRQTFEPRSSSAPFFDRFPDYERVRVTTGWIKADVAGRTAIDERIATDPERFWDQFQAKTLPALYDHVMALGRGKPRAEDAPFFGELTVDLTLSEPDYRLPVDQEQISTMEALHEEIYFNTLHFFDVMGRFTRGAGLAYPGRVIPIVHPKADGKPGRAKISVTGFDAPRPSVVVDYVERDGRAGEARLDIPKVAVDRPQTLAASVRAGRDGIERLDLRCQGGHREGRARRAGEARRRTSASIARSCRRSRLTAVVREPCHGCALPACTRTRSPIHDLGSVRLTVAWEHESKAGTEVVATLDPNGAPAALPDIRKAAPPAAAAAHGGPIVQWDTPIPPPEAYEILAKMSTFKEATVYKVGESYLGKDVWAMDLMPPVDASHWSQAKQTTLKPTIVYSARQHANEVSSTSHVLRMAELLLTDPVYREKLNKVNVVIHPITNADGAQLAYDLQKINPNHMLHAGYLGALGVDVTSAQWDADPIYPESGIRPKIWRTWLPDIFLNPHGYPSHEWVQMFSEYAAWVRTRSVETRDYWTMRGWWMPGFGWLDDARYPRHKDEQMKLLNMITEYVKAAPGDRGVERARLRALQAIQLRVRPEELQARFHQRRADLQVDQGRARQPAEPGLHDAQPERHDLGGRHRGARRDRARRLAEAGRERRAAVGQGDPRVPRAGTPRGRAEGGRVLERRHADDEPAAAPEAAEDGGGDEHDRRSGQVGQVGAGRGYGVASGAGPETSASPTCPACPTSPARPGRVLSRRARKSRACSPDTR